MTIEQREGLKRSDSSLQAVANTFLQTGQSLESLQALLSAEGHPNMDQILREHGRERPDQHFLESLKFSDLIHGQKRIVDAHKETYQWIFDASGQRLGNWSNFVTWLQQGHGTYWINGKAGSGKSTLMNFIWQNQQTLDHLRAWAGTKSILTPLFFFSVTGTQLQQSVEGLLRSLICQILEKYRQFVPNISQETWTPSARAQAFPVWTEEKLRHCFQTLIKTITPSLRICIFIDGLDECSGDHRELLGLVSQVADNQDVKVCFSSRPEKPFEEFSPSCSLRLQDLTKEDMQVYVKTKIDGIPQFQSLSFDKLSWKDAMQRLIVERAQGVFLWVELVTKSQINGIRNGDDLATLERKLSCLPGEVEELYSRMLAKMNGYESEAAKYLQLAHHFTKETHSIWSTLDSHVLNFAIARFGLTNSLRLSSKLNRRNVVSRCVEVSERIPITCGGFLEVYDNEQQGTQLEEINENDLWLAWEPPEIRSTSPDVDWCCKSIRFLHRSARDFFETEAKGGEFLKRHTECPESGKLLGSALYIARMKLCNLREQRAIEKYMLYHVSCSMDVAYYAGDHLTSSQISPSVELLEYFDGIANKLYRDDSSFAGSQHWSERWLLPYLKRRKGIFVRNSRQVEAPFPCRYAPTDLRSSAAFWKLDWYLRGSSETKPMDSEKATQMAICTVTHCGSLRVTSHVNLWYLEWKIHRLADVETLMSLARQGANPNKGILTSIWEEVLHFLYKARLECLHFPEVITDESIAKIFQCFSEAGAHADRTLFLNLDVFERRYGRLSVRFDLDTSSLPIIWIVKENHVDSSKNAETSEFRPLRLSKRPLRLSFGIMMDIVDRASATEMISNYGTDGDGREESKKESLRSRETESEDDSGTKGQSTGDPNFHETYVSTSALSGVRIEWNTKVMTETQARELYQILRERLDVKERPKPSGLRFSKLMKPLLNWLHETHRNCFPEEYEPHLWKTALDYHSDSGEEDTEDSDYDD